MHEIHGWPWPGADAVYGWPWPGANVLAVARWRSGPLANGRPKSYVLCEIVNDAEPGLSRNLPRGSKTPAAGLLVQPRRWPGSASNVDPGARRNLRSAREVDCGRAGRGRLLRRRGRGPLRRVVGRHVRPRGRRAGRRLPRRARRRRARARARDRHRPDRAAARRARRAGARHRAVQGDGRAAAGEAGRRGDRRHDRRLRDARPSTGRSRSRTSSSTRSTTSRRRTARSRASATSRGTSSPAAAS